MTVSNVDFGSEGGEFDADVAGCVAQSDKKDTLVLELLELLFAVLFLSQHYVQGPALRRLVSTCL